MRKKVILYSLLFFGLLILLFIVRPAWHLLETKLRDRNDLIQLQPGYADDVSHLNKTKVDSVVVVSSNKADAEKQLKQLLHYADSSHIPVSIAGAGHSMGGHTIAPNGIQINMLTFKYMSLNTQTNILTVGAGAIWADVIPYLDRYKRAVSIMQSDNAFSVGGSISVNCHGWQHDKPPISSTILAFRLMNAKGDILNCSRKENQELFSLALGGYGLFGTILEVDMVTVPNESYTYHRIAMPSEKYISYYSKYINDARNVKMVYGRLNVNKEHFLEKAMLNFFVSDSAVAPGLVATESGVSELKRSIFLASKEDDYGKKFRWESEQVVTKVSIGKHYTRNEVMNDSPLLYMNRTNDRTDILEEYFIPKERFNEFVHALQSIMPKYHCDLLNVTIRNVRKDEDTYLNYAREEIFGFVMFFNQSLTSEAEKEMESQTQEILDAAISLGGTYYLPYRLHATKQQFLKTYPMAKAFFERKRKYDPGEMFQNKFYLKYGRE